MLHLTPLFHPTPHMISTYQFMLKQIDHICFSECKCYIYNIIFTRLVNDAFAKLNVNTTCLSDDRVNLVAYITGVSTCNTAVIFLTKVY